MGRRGCDSGKEQMWRNVFRRWDSSDLPIRAFCQRERLSESSFHGWRRTIAERDRLAKPAPLDRQASQAPAFVPVSVELPLTAPAIEIVASTGRVVRVPVDFDADTLRRVLCVLEEGSSC